MLNTWNLWDVIRRKHQPAVYRYSRVRSILNKVSNNSSTLKHNIKHFDRWNIFSYVIARPVMASSSRYANSPACVANSFTAAHSWTMKPILHNEYQTRSSLTFLTQWIMVLDPEISYSTDYEPTCHQRSLSHEKNKYLSRMACKRGELTKWACAYPCRPG